MVAVCVLSEDLSGTPDEGIKKVALAVGDALARRHRVTLLGTWGDAPMPGTRLARAGRTFLSAALRRELARQDPQVLLYVARSSTTTMAFLRARLLAAYCPRATIALVGLQARRHGRLQRAAIRRIRPHVVCVQSDESRRYLERLGCSVRLFRSGVDVERFRPVDRVRRDALRAQHHLRADLPVALHVGHLTSGRGIGVLADLARGGECQVVLVASTFTAQERALADELRSAGVILRTEYEPHVEQLYQLADCYVFPVASTDNSIEVPLSVLEAFACDLPVVTRRFGALWDVFGRADAPGLVFVDSPAALVDEALRLCRNGPGGTRVLALPYAWEAVASDLLDGVLSMDGETRA